MTECTSRLRTYVASWYEQTPIVTKLITISHLVLSVVAMSYRLVQYVANIPILVIENFQVYRVFTSGAVENNLLSLLFVIIWLNQFGLKIEQDFGSKTYGLFFFNHFVDYKCVPSSCCVRALLARRIFYVLYYELCGVISYNAVLSCYCSTGSPNSNHVSSFRDSPAIRCTCSCCIHDIAHGRSSANR